MESTRQNLFVVYSDLYLNWLLGRGDGSHVTNPMRAKLAIDKLIASLGDRTEVVHPVDPTKEKSDEAALAATHDASYIKRVISGDCNQWDNLRPIMGQTAYQMFQGTIRAVEIILSVRAGLYSTHKELSTMLSSQMLLDSASSMTWLTQLLP
jgi:acetoin utilization protein AcuC